MGKNAILRVSRLEMLLKPGNMQPWLTLSGYLICVGGGIGAGKI